MVAQSELRGRYMAIICTEVWPGSTSMQKYMDKNFNYAVELENDDIYVIDKPSIKKDFCFGYGYCGMSTLEDDRRAARVAEHARTSEDYFIEENLKEINDRIKRLEEAKEGKYVGYKYCNYTGQPNGSKLKAYTLCYSWEGPEDEPYKWERLTDVEKLTEKEIDALIHGYEIVKSEFTKRLNTYLKRYGLSKLNVWTYLRD